MKIKLADDKTFQLFMENLRFPIVIFGKILTDRGSTGRDKKCSKASTEKSAAVNIDGNFFCPCQ